MRTADRKTSPVALLASAKQAVDDAAARQERIRQISPNLYKSLLITRLSVGIVGVLLPTVIILWDLGFDLFDPDQPWGLRGSLSAYYYHSIPLASWFVGSLWAIGVGLMAYMSNFRSNAANKVTWVAGSAAILVALIPTNDGGATTWMSNLHFIAAGVVIVGLGVISVGFGIDDKRRPEMAKYRWIHFGAAGLIGFAVLFVAANNVWDIWPSHGVLFAELIAVYAFAVSWFAKGSELFAYNRERPSNAVGAPLKSEPESVDTAALAAQKGS